MTVMNNGVMFCPIQPPVVIKITWPRLIDYSKILLPNEVKSLYSGVLSIRCLFTPRYRSDSAFDTNQQKQKKKLLDETSHIIFVLFRKRWTHIMPYFE